MIFLSCCIPSYNRAKFLPDLLQSIVLQYDERVEIVICDNGSTDGTEAVALEWQKKYPRIVYERFEKNVGPDRCFIRSVERASGTYCWLLGDDDILEPEGLKNVLKTLEEKPHVTGITVNRAAYDITLQKRWIEPDAARRKEDKVFYKTDTFFEELYTLFGFLSAQIVKKEAWMEIVEKDVEIASYYNAYALIYIIGRMMQKQPYWVFLHTPCIGWRSGNDSFAQQLGVYRRFLLDLNGYLDITRGLLRQDPSLYQNVMNQICRMHLVAHIRGMKWSGFFTLKIWTKTLFISFSKLKTLSSFWWPFLPTLLSPTWALRAFRFVYRRCQTAR